MAEPMTDAERRHIDWLRVAHQPERAMGMHVECNICLLLRALDQAEARGAWLLTDNRRLRILAGEDDPADAADLQRIAGKPVGILEASAVGGGRKFDPAGPSAPPRAGGEK